MENIEKIIAVINSCETSVHLEGAKRMIENYNKGVPAYVYSLFMSKVIKLQNQGV